MIGSNCFSVDSETKTLVSEISTVEAQQLIKPDIGRDLRIISTKTGGIAIFSLVEKQKHRLGDLEALVYRPDAETIRNNPNLEGWKVVLYND